MTEQILAYCGIDCAACPAYIATQANDIDKLTSLAGEWFDGATDYSIILCDGCKSQERIMKWCGECPTRDCAMERELDSCAYCAEYAGSTGKGCEKLLKVFEMSEDARKNMERIRATL